MTIHHPLQTSPSFAATRPDVNVTLFLITRSFPCCIQLPGTSFLLMTCKLLSHCLPKLPQHCTWPKVADRVSTRPPMPIYRFLSARPKSYKLFLDDIRWRLMILACQMPRRRTTGCQKRTIVLPSRSSLAIIKTTSDATAWNTWTCATILRTLSAAFGSHILRDRPPIFVIPPILRDPLTDLVVLQQAASSLNIHHVQS